MRRVIEVNQKYLLFRFLQILINNVELGVGTIAKNGAQERNAALLSIRFNVIVNV